MTKPKRPPIQHGTQEWKLLEYLKRQRNISGIEALHLFKVRDLPKRISELRERGIQIEGLWKTDETGARYKRYFLKSMRRAKNKPTEPVKPRFEIVKVAVHDAYYEYADKIIGLTGTFEPGPGFPGGEVSTGWHCGTLTYDKVKPVIRHDKEPLSRSFFFKVWLRRIN